MCCFKIKVIPDTIAVNSDLSKSDLIVIGTTNLQLITSWINPFNDKRSMMIYTAQNAKDLIKCNRIQYNNGITIAKSNELIKYRIFKNPVRVCICGSYKRD